MQRTGRYMFSRPLLPAPIHEQFKPGQRTMRWFHFQRNFIDGLPFRERGERADDLLFHLDRALIERETMEDA